MKPCAFCGHPLELHCKGGVAHTDHKEDQRMMPVNARKGTTVCRSRHCLGALCCCIEYQEAK